MHSSGSLVAFTLLFQCAVGLVWALLPLRWVDFPAGVAVYRWSWGLALVMSSTGLAAAVGHLGSPRNAFHALRNLPRSWLSREVAAASAFTGLLGLLLVFTHPPNSQWMTVGTILCAMAGAIALHTMIRVYGLKTVPTWNNRSTPLAFIAAALILGGAVNVVLTRFLHPHAPVPWTALLIVVGGIVCKTIAGFIAVSRQRRPVNHSWYAAGTPSISEPAATVCGIGMQWCAGGMLTMGTTGEHALAGSLSALVLACSAEVYGRWRFYQRYARIGL